MAYKKGNRMQNTFLPSVIDDYIGQKDPARVYDAFVEALNFEELGIHIQPYKGGADEYYPKDMLKLFVYGYSYGTRTSRKLERACHHNLSFIWLMGDLKPDYRTIARFRSDNKDALKKVLKQCVRMCIDIGLVGGNTLFTDGSKFRANAGIKNTQTQESLKQELKEIELRIDKLIDESEAIDQAEEKQESLMELKEEIKDQGMLIETIKGHLKKITEEQLSSINTTDPDCVKASFRQGKHSAYNIQATVDQKHGLIVSAEAVSQNNDVNQLNRQIKEATENLGKKPKNACADSGYASTQDLKEIDKDIVVIVPSQKQAQKENRKYPLKPFDKEEFKYNKERDEYTCPEGKRLKHAGIHSTKPLKINYQASAEECRQCSYFGICTKSESGRKIVRLGDEEFKEQLGVIYNSPSGQEIYKERKEKAELPFGHMKYNLGAGQFMLRGRAKVNAEVSLLSTCFNIARMITIIGVSELILKLNGA